MALENFEQFQGKCLLFVVVPRFCFRRFILPSFHEKLPFSLLYKVIRYTAYANLLRGPLYFYKNLRIERFWVEVNARVNYPIKYALRDMEQRGVVDMELECTKFYVSSVSLRVASVVMKRTVNT